MNSKKNVAIVIHIYYEDKGINLLKKIMKLKFEYDLFITIIKGKDYTKLKKYIKQLDLNRNNINLFEIDNKGYDVWPFVYVIKKIIDKYELILKVHTKNTNRYLYLYFKYIINNKEWGDMLITKLLNNKIKLQIDKMIENKNITITVVRDLFLKEERKKMIELINNLIISKNLNINKVRQISFSAGTMFLIRTENLKFLTSFNEQDFKITNSKEKDFTLAHVLERVICINCQNNINYLENSQIEKLLLTIKSFLRKIFIIKEKENKFIVKMFGKRII